jgi:hypothetical protein
MPYCVAGLCRYHPIFGPKDFLSVVKQVRDPNFVPLLLPEGGEDEAGELQIPNFVPFLLPEGGEDEAGEVQIPNFVPFLIGCGRQVWLWVWL